MQGAMQESVPRKYICDTCAKKLKAHERVVACSCGKVLCTQHRLKVNHNCNSQIPPTELHVLSRKVEII